MTSAYDQHLPRTPANFAPLSPLGFLERAAEVYPERLAIVHGALRQTWGQTYTRCRQLASALQRSGIGKNDAARVGPANCAGFRSRWMVSLPASARRRKKPSVALPGAHDIDHLDAREQLLYERLGDGHARIFADARCFPGGLP